MNGDCLGIDIGSRTIKLVHLAGDTVSRREVADATSRPAEVVATLLADHPGIPCLATGYGRHLLEIHDIPSVTEIKACARGVASLYGGNRTVIDIGGQDVKVIVLDDRGKVSRFEMNDRCAAGTGKFLEIMAQRLDYTLKDFGRAALAGSDSLTISSLCTVFAESEVIGLLNRSERREDIARAIHRSVIKKVSGMFKRIAPPGGSVTAVGGGVRNQAVVQLLEGELQRPIDVPEHPQIVAALGAALLCVEMQNR